MPFELFAPIAKDIRARHQLKAQTASWADPARFQTENLAGKPFEALVVELKGR